MLTVLIATDTWREINGITRLYRSVLETLDRNFPDTCRLIIVHAAHEASDAVVGSGHRVIGVVPRWGFAVPQYPELFTGYVTHRQFDALERRHGPFDVVHIPTQGLVGLSAARYARDRAKRCVGFYHTNWPHYVSEYMPRALGVPLRRRLGRALGRWWDRKAYGACGDIVVHTPRSANWLSKPLRGSLVMAAQFLERRRFAPAGPAGERARENGAVVFGIVGRLAKEKHHERVLRHASAIRNAGGQLVVIGDGPEREALGAFKDAVFVGWQAGEALIAWYRKLDYLVMAADSDTLGLVLLEAAGCGTPAVALKGTVAGDYLERRMSGMAVERFSPELFHELIATARTDVYSRMCAEALALADDHDITRGTRTLLDVWGKQASARERSRQRRPELARVLKGCNPVVAAPSRRGLML